MHDSSLSYSTLLFFTLVTQNHASRIVRNMGLEVGTIEFESQLFYELQMCRCLISPILSHCSCKIGRMVMQINDTKHAKHSGEHLPCNVCSTHNGNVTIPLSPSTYFPLAGSSS